MITQLMETNPSQSVTQISHPPSAAILRRLWEEAEQTVARELPKSNPTRPQKAENSQVRYAYD